MSSGPSNINFRFWTEDMKEWWKARAEKLYGGDLTRCINIELATIMPINWRKASGVGAKPTKEAVPAPRRTVAKRSGAGPGPTKGREMPKKK